VREVAESPAYPMQLMLNVYEFARDEQDSSSDRHPKEFLVDWVRGWRRDADADQEGLNSIVGSGLG